MLQVVSHPVNLSDWDPNLITQPFYFELYGETKPAITMDFAEVLPVGQSESAFQNTSPLSIYEYSWTIGHSEDKPLNFIWSGLQEPAAKVFLYFPISRGWRVREFVATVKYLTPVPDQEKWLEKVSQLSKDVSPFVSDMSSILRLVPGGPFPEIASILSIIAKLQINSVPRVKGFEWSVKKVTHQSEYGVMQGIEWTIPKELFQLLGTRLTGSVAVCFIPSVNQKNYNIFDEQQENLFQQGTILARAEIHGPDKEKPFYVPPDQECQEKEFVKLQIAPTNKKY